eukprot:CAMPEP_0174385744 /NCGR_PEP_ID=MMETSP0811_2-20130205/126808_1 /TAXON_ID=73025 ORGANISM="Eutreptiella gymnastica-like, Strain CCMP1594" /NCGR_SAMPLE_ID=MMETSP0811_2 /ASSEMBLY_ACC=CAM_ASM_000667 /LENGTH=255 /DNA_ID=CAMNT_0015540175 /DNA_START=22 /DNA_END=789 /DNA_ORIENTATION=+
MSAPADASGTSAQGPQCCRQPWNSPKAVGGAVTTVPDCQASPVRDYSTATTARPCVEVHARRSAALGPGPVNAPDSALGVSHFVAPYVAGVRAFHGLSLSLISYCHSLCQFLPHVLLRCCAPLPPKGQFCVGPGPNSPPPPPDHQSHINGEEHFCQEACGLRCSTGAFATSIVVCWNALFGLHRWSMRNLGGFKALGTSWEIQKCKKKKLTFQGPPPPSLMPRVLGSKADATPCNPTHAARHTRPHLRLHHLMPQ